MNEAKTLFGKRVRYLRRLRGLTQAQLAEKMHLSTNYVSQIETGVASPTFDTLSKLATGQRSRIHKVPHFNVKCHRSRSNIKLQGKGNDRYSTSSFDILITNPFNALIKQGTVGEDLELVNHPGIIQILEQHYTTQDEAALLLAVASDWRFVVPADIAVDGLIPRTPTVFLVNDPYWKPLAELEKVVTAIALDRYAQARKKSGRN